MAKIVLAYSGGLDCTVLLWDLIRQGRTVHCVTVDYGQPARAELVQAAALCRQAAGRRGAGQEVTHRVVALDQCPTVIVAGDGHPHAELPNRSLIVLAIAAGIALAEGAEAVAWGDRIDTSPRERFHFDFGRLLNVCHGDRLGVYAPYVERTKAELVRRGVQLQAPLSETWSCLAAGREHCGLCRGCRRRRRAFAEAGHRDSTAYAAAPRAPVYT